MYASVSYRGKDKTSHVYGVFAIYRGSGLSLMTQPYSLGIGNVRPFKHSQISYRMFRRIVRYNTSVKK